MLLWVYHDKVITFPAARCLSMGLSMHTRGGYALLQMLSQDLIEVCMCGVMHRETSLGR
jgi:hypothetical protein